MKLKKWIICTYIAVMILPVINLCVIYESVQSYSEKIKLKDYIQINNIINKYESKLQDIDLYTNTPDEINIISNKDKKDVTITVYNKKGIIFYASQDNIISLKEDVDNLYKDVGAIKQDFNQSSFKKQVTDKDGNVVGFYKITVHRSQVIRNAQYLTILGIAIFILLFCIVLFVMIKIMNRKLNKPLNLLMDNMTEYAQGNKNVSIISEYKANDEIGQLIKHFENMKNEVKKSDEQLEKIRKEKEYMIAAISHDLKSPLTSIRAYAESINSMDNLSVEEKREYTSVIINKSDFMYKMIEDLLTYILLASDVKMEFVEVDGEEFFEMLSQGYNELCKTNNIELKVDLNVTGTYKVDVKYMIRCMDNLVSNAIRYTSEGQCIYIGAFSSENSLPDWIAPEFKEKIEELKAMGVVFLVKNIGAGIKKEQMNEIIKPFYQIDTSRNKNKKDGAGLGLSIAHMIINDHNGKLKIFSDEESFVIIAGAIPKKLCPKAKKNHI